MNNKFSNVKKNIVEVLICMLIGLAIGAGAGYLAGQAIDRSFERECGTYWRDKAPQHCKDFWTANGITKKTQDKE